MDTVMNLIYSISPRHTDEYYAQKARDAAALKPYRLCFKDVGGMLTPDRTRDLVRLIKQNIGDIPLEFHAHCNNGLGPFNLLEAVKEGRAHRAYRNPATRQRLFTAFGIQCGRKLARARLQAAHQHGTTARRERALRKTSRSEKVYQSAHRASSTNPGTAIKCRAE
jgi:hypothetical protein